MTHQVNDSRALAAAVSHSDALLSTVVITTVVLSVLLATAVVVCFVVIVTYKKRRRNDAPTTTSSSSDTPVKVDDADDQMTWPGTVRADGKVEQVAELSVMWMNAQTPEADNDEKFYY